MQNELAVECHGTRPRAPRDQRTEWAYIFDRGLCDRAAIPDNITVLALPPRSPELNPVENVWQFMRDNWLSNRIFKSYEDIVALCCQPNVPKSLRVNCEDQI